MQPVGKFIISLDFELMWGMFDKVSTTEYGDAIDGVPDVLPQLLALFTEYDIHATWATVGMLLCENKAALHAARPKITPQYVRAELSSYQHFDTAPIDDTDPRYFASELVRKISAAPGQELASHTFSHYYCLEEQSGGEGEAFAADCQAFQAIMAPFSTTCSSLVFPRNQWSSAALQTAAAYGITCYRGTENNVLYRARTDQQQHSVFIRALRLIDTYLNLTGYHTFVVDHTEQPTNVPASRFLRPYNKTLFLLEPLRLRRIKTAMTHAAKNGECFHLWWHPHNFGRHQAKNLRQLTSLLRHYKKLHKKYGLQSVSMREAATPNDE